jgi:hypothetical protein
MKTQIMLIVSIVLCSLCTLFILRISSFSLHTPLALIDPLSAYVDQYYVPL